MNEPVPATPSLEELANLRADAKAREDEARDERKRAESLILQHPDFARRMKSVGKTDVIEGLSVTNSVESSYDQTMLTEIYNGLSDNERGAWLMAFETLWKSQGKKAVETLLRHLPHLEEKLEAATVTKPRAPSFRAEAA